MTEPPAWARAMNELRVLAANSLRQHVAPQLPTTPTQWQRRTAARINGAKRQNCGRRRCRRATPRHAPLCRPSSSKQQERETAMLCLQLPPTTPPQPRAILEYTCHTSGAATTHSIQDRNSFATLAPPPRRRARCPGRWGQGALRSSLLGIK